MSKHLLDEVDVANIRKFAHEDGLRDGIMLGRKAAMKETTDSILSNFLEQFDESEIMRVLEKEWPGIVEAYEMQGVENADPSDMVGEPMRNEGYD